MAANFSNILKELRVEKKITQAGLAQALGVGTSTISMYETGARKPDFEAMEAIADFFDVDMDFLYGRTEKTNEVKRNYDEMFRIPQVTNGAMAYAMMHAIEGTSEDYSQIPEADQQMVKKAVTFMNSFMELSEEKRQEVFGYMEYLVQKEKDERTNDNVNG